MPNKPKIFILFLAFFIASLYSTIYPPTSDAQSCSGVQTCCGSFSYYRIPAGCVVGCPPDDPDCVECTDGVAQGECLTTYTDTCEYNDVYGGCGYNCPQGIVGENNCSYTPPPPPPPPIASGWSCVSAGNCAWVAGGNAATTEAACEAQPSCQVPSSMPPPPVCSCGNGIYEPQCGESCDDGNQDNLDGCTTSCTSDPAAACTALVDAVHCGANYNGGYANVPGSGGAACGTDISKMFKISMSSSNPFTYVFATNHSEDNVECPANWGTNNNDDSWTEGLAVMKGRIEDFGKNQNGDYPDSAYITANMIGVIGNGWGSISRSYGSQLAEGENYFILPKCAAGTNGFEIAKNVGCYRANQAPAPVSKTCTVAASASSIVQGEPLTLTITGGADFASSDVVRLHVEKTDFSQISPAPDPLEFPNPAVGDTNPYISGSNYYYQIPAARCNSTGPGTCSGTATISSLPAGSYNFHCDVHHAEPDTLKCSGNPYCEGKWTTDCAGWTSCSNTDNVGVTIEPPPPPILNISGTVYEGIGSVSGNYCQEVIDSEWSDGGEMTVSVGGNLDPGPDPSGTTNVNGDNGQYESGVIQKNSGTAVVTLNNIPAGYTLTCPNPNAYSISTLNMTEDATGVNFFISKKNNPWWQTRSGLVHAQGNIGNNLPWFENVMTTDCLAAGGNCVPYLITQDLNGVDINTSGIPTASGSFDDISADYPTELEFGGVAPYASGHSNAGVTMPGYAQLSSRFDLSTENITTGTISNKPTGGSVQGDATVYYASGDLIIAPPQDGVGWTINSGEKIIIFVDGSVVMDGYDAGPYITVEEGGFFAVIASGDLRFNEAMGHDLSSGGFYNLAPNIEGIYVADGTLTVSDYWTDSIQDRKFVGAGSFIGLSGVSFPRNFEFDDGNTPNLSGLLNNDVPTETFIFRPDLVLNTPELMKKSTFTWQEINQITP